MILMPPLDQGNSRNAPHGSNGQDYVAYCPETVSLIPDIRCRQRGDGELSLSRSCSALSCLVESTAGYRGEIELCVLQNCRGTEGNVMILFIAVL
jgi:hypothetical protein